MDMRQQGRDEVKTRPAADLETLFNPENYATLAFAFGVEMALAEAAGDSARLHRLLGARQALARLRVAVAEGRVAA